VCVADDGSAVLLLWDQQRRGALQPGGQRAVFKAPAAPGTLAPVGDAAVLLAWLFTGLLGGHHFLLRRHVHGLLWLTSGGGFGVGWALELFRLRSLRADAAGDRPAAIVSRAGVVTPLLRPGAGGARGVAHYVAGLALGRWYYSFVSWGALLLGAPAGAAHAAGLTALTLAIWAVDNASHSRGSSLRAVALAGAAAAAAATAADAGAPLLWTASAAQLASCLTRRWRGADDAALSGRAALRITAALALLAALLVARLLAAEGGAREWLWELLDNLGVRITINGASAGGAGGAGWESSSSSGGGGGGPRAGFDFGSLARGAGGMSRREAARVLGVGAGADARAVREAFRRLSLQHHPDKAAVGGGGAAAAAAEAMQTRLNAAREVLLRNAATA
jgi:DnaJ-domain-containing protein 1